MKAKDFIDQLNRELDLMVEELANQMGELGKPVSAKRQMQAFHDMQPEDTVEMITEKGLPDTLKYIKEMRRREALSKNATTTIPET